MQRPTGLHLRTALSLSLLLAHSSLAQNTSIDPEVAKAAGVLYSNAGVGALIRDWCLEQAPAQKTTINQGYAAWAQAFGLPGIEKYIRSNFAAQMPQITAAINGQRAKVYAKLSQVSQTPVEDCKNIKAQLMNDADLSKLYPQEYALTRSIRQGTAPAAPSRVGAAPRPASVPTTSSAGGGPFLQGTDFTPFERSDALKGLNSLGGAAPYSSGGAFKAGAYACERQETDDDNNIISTSRYTLNLFSDRGVKVTGGTTTYRTGSNTIPVTQGTYTYDPKTGKINVDADLDSDALEDLIAENGQYHSVLEEQTLYNIFRFVTDAGGKGLLYGQVGYGPRYHTQTFCRYAGTPQGISPIEAARRTAAAEETAFNRYRVRPNAGLKNSQIEALLHGYENQYVGSNVIGEESTFLLLKDGSLYLNLRWTPNDLDINASRKGEPQNWTKWRKQGSTYLYLKDGEWVGLKGFKVVPGGKNEVLKGSFESLSSFTSGTMMAGSTSVTRRYLSFTGNKFKQAGWNQVSGSMDFGNVQTTGNTFTAAKDQEGTYTFSGYTLELRYASGRVMRTYAYFWDARKNDLVISGVTWHRK